MNCSANCLVLHLRANISDSEIRIIKIGFEA